MTTRTFRHRATGKVVTEIKVRETVKNKPEPSIYIYQESGVTMERFPEWVVEDTAAWVEQFAITKIEDLKQAVNIPASESITVHNPVQWQADMWGWNEESQFIFRVNKVMDDFMGNVTIDESWSYKSNSAISQRWKLLIIPGDSTPATPEQIKKYLVEELNRRGYGKIGMSITPMGVDYGTFGDYTTVGICYLSEFDTLLLNGIAIYQRGQWATIVKDEVKEENVDNRETYWKYVGAIHHKCENGKIYPGLKRWPVNDPEYPSIKETNSVSELASTFTDQWLQVTREEYEAQERKATPINSQVEEIKKAVWAIGIHESMYKSCKKFVEWYEENIGKKTDTNPGNNS